MSRSCFVIGSAVVLLCSLLAAQESTVTPLSRAHAHNDYLHDRPLLDALDHGFCSVEADIFLVDGALLVAHDLKDTTQERTLETLYLNPLRERIQANGGRVYPGGASFQLLIDLKSAARTTYPVLRKQLEEYQDILTRFSDDRIHEGAVTVVLSGNRPFKILEDEEERLCGIDGRLGDLKKEFTAGQLPLISDHWGRHFTWEGDGAFPGQEREKLEEIVAATHSRGAKVRFWATPENEALWQVLRDAGVDYINTDQLAKLQGFLLDNTTLRVQKISDTAVDAEARTIKGGFGICINGKSFQQDALVSHNGYQYVSYYDKDGWVCVARRKLPDDAWAILRLSDYPFKSDDAHNTISMGICPADGTIHLAFDHHGHPLHYRVSQKAVATQPEDVVWEASLFGPVKDELEPGRSIKITYPRFIRTPDGGLQFCYRQGGSGNGDRMLVDYDPGSGLWKNTRMIDSHKGTFQDAVGKSSSRCSYPNGYDYGPSGRLHTTWVWRESAQGSNHDLIYVYSDDGGIRWRNTAGELINGPPRVDSPGIVAVPIPQTLGLMNTHGQAVDRQGRIHTVIWHSTPETLAAAGATPGEHKWGLAESRRYHHYWRDDHGEWQHVEMPWVAGNRPKLFMDAQDNAILIYRETGGDLCIAAATAATAWRDWQVIHSESGSFINEMLGDAVRWRSEGVLSIMVQEQPLAVRGPSALRVLDFRIAIP